MKLIGSLSLLFLYNISFGTPNFISSDSLPKENPAHWRLTSRLHTKGAFFYSGRIISDHLVSDIGFAYDRKKWGFQLFKAADLADHNTDINFCLVVLYKNFKVGKRITITPNAGFFLEQKRSLADKGSDAVVIVNTALKLNQYFTIDHAAIFGGLVMTHDYNWTNRLRVLFTAKLLTLLIFYGTTTPCSMILAICHQGLALVTVASSYQIMLT